MPGPAFFRIPWLVFVLWLLAASLATEPPLTSAYPAPPDTARTAPASADDVLAQTMQPPADAFAPPTVSDEDLALANLDLPEANLPRTRPEPLQPEQTQMAGDDPAPDSAIAADAQAPPAADASSTPGPEEKWIDVNLSEQSISAYVGSTVVRTGLISSGLPAHPTVVGRFHVYLKLTAQRMKGGSPETHDFYDLPNVPNVMYFYADYAIHGAYWHHNFGHPMSHGCVNLPLDDAQWFFEWAPIGTLVVVHV